MQYERSYHRGEAKFRDLEEYDTLSNEELFQSLNKDTLNQVSRLKFGSKLWRARVITILKEKNKACRIQHAKFPCKQIKTLTPTVFFKPKHTDE